MLRIIKKKQRHTKLARNLSVSFADGTSYYLPNLAALEQHPVAGQRCMCSYRSFGTANEIQTTLNDFVGDLTTYFTYPHFLRACHWTNPWLSCPFLQTRSTGRPGIEDQLRIGVKLESVPRLINPVFLKLKFIASVLRKYNLCVLGCS